VSWCHHYRDCLVTPNTIQAAAEKKEDNLTKTKSGRVTKAAPKTAGKKAAPKKAAAGKKKEPKKAAEKAEKPAEAPAASS